MLPVTPVSEGGGELFLKRMAVFASTLPDIFGRLDKFSLRVAYRGLHKLRFCERLEKGSAVRSWYDKTSDCLTIYPMAFIPGNRIDIAVYEGLGERHWALNMTTADKVRWTKKLVIPDMATIDRVINYVKDGGGDYTQIVKKFSTSNDRLQAIHIFNALIANAVKPDKAKHLNLKTFPATKDFCIGAKPFSLIPLISAYFGSGKLDNYKDAFAWYLSNSGRFNVSETSVESQLVKLFQAVTFGN